MERHAPIDITPAQRATILALLAKHLPDTQVWAYGSRVKWTSTTSSDLDLVAFATAKQRGAVADLREALEESDLPFRVDLFVWDEVPETFRRQIAAEHAALRTPSAVPTGWRTVRLGDCVVMNGGVYAKGDAWPVINYLETGNITENRIDNIHTLEPGTDKIPSRARRKVRPGDIVYSTVRPNQRHFGLLKTIPAYCVASTGFAVMRAVEGVADTGFLYRFLSQSRTVDRLQTIAEQSTSAYPSIRPSDLQELRLELPPLSEQRAVARVLGALDDRIELNRRMSRILEAMASALFKSWFVDFEPVRARMEGRDTGLPQDIAGQFPDRLVDSPLGKVPDGWPLVELPKLMEINPPRHLKKGTTAPYLAMANMPQRGHVPLAVRRRRFGSGVRFAQGDTLVARITPCLENGKTAYVDFLRDDEVGWGSTEYIVLKPSQSLPGEFAYFLARSTGFRKFAIRNMSGTSGRQRVSVAALSGFSMAAPPLEIVASFGRAARRSLRRVRAAADESDALANCRNALLPELVSGTLRVFHIDGEQ